MNQIEKMVFESFQNDLVLFKRFTRIYYIDTQIEEIQSKHLRLSVARADLKKERDYIITNNQFLD